MNELAFLILAGIGITCLLSTLIVLSLAWTAPAEPQEQTPFTQAIIDQVEK